MARLTRPGRRRTTWPRVRCAGEASRRSRDEHPDERTSDRLQGLPAARARARSSGSSVRRLERRARSPTTPARVFEGVILPRSETCDDLHVVIKLKNGYNVGVHVRPHRARSSEVGYKEAVYKIPEKEFPSGPTLPNVTLLGTGGTIASPPRLPDRRRHPGLHAGRALRRRAGAGRHLRT
ncbi:MAG: hypothetical protein MZV64_13955 [Ignavibacteriales bacterium]|nr:hypothetical protein [Ignavibacteriales bacterium]